MSVTYPKTGYIAMSPGGSQVSAAQPNEDMAIAIAKKWAADLGGNPCYYVVKIVGVVTLAPAQARYEKP